MNVYHDILDWLVGLPYEVASPDEIENFCQKCTKIDIWQTNTVTGLIFTDLDAVYGSDDGLKRKIT